MPPYAILSHCWGDNEMLFKDFRKKRNCVGQGYQKILNCCTYARSVVWHEERVSPGEEEGKGNLVVRRGLEWAWVDTW